MIEPRRILLTGASSGIGFEAAVQLRRAGHRLLLPCRDAATAEATLRRLEDGPGSIAPVVDLADVGSVERFAADLLAEGEPIDVLVLNAGLQYAGSAEPLLSAQGVELTFAVNHLAHQVLAQQLLPLLVAGQAPRLVVTASEVHDPTTGGGRVGRPAGLGDLAGLRSGPGFAMVDGLSRFDAEKAYKDSKLCNLLFAREFDRRTREGGTPLTVIAWSPGLVIPPGRAGFFRYSRAHNEWGQRLFAFLARDLLRLSESVKDAGALLARLATDPAEDEPGFRYRVNRLIAPGRHRLEAASPSAEASDSARARLLWDLTRRLAAMLEEGMDGESPRH